MNFVAPSGNIISIIGKVVLHATSSVTGLQDVRLKFNDDDFTIEAVSNPETGTPLAFTHSSDEVVVTLPAPLSIGTEFKMAIEYEGRPFSSDYVATGGNAFGTAPRFGTKSQPKHSYVWWPSKVSLTDKFTTTLRGTAPENTVLMSNGRLVESIANGDGTTSWLWAEDYPIASDLVSVLIGDYSVMTDTYTSLDGQTTMPVYALAPAESMSGAAEQLFGETPQMLGVFAARFGEYPFINEKYAQGPYAMAASIENQTASHINRTFLQTSNAALGTWLVAHELAHQWFGDKVGVSTYDHLWLSEGLATFAEALWFEARDGAEAYRDYMREFGTTGTLSRPVVADTSNMQASIIFSIVVYHRGAWVAHMLRGIMGDEDFFAALHEYMSAPSTAYGTADTATFQAIAEAHYGGPLDWYFTPWLTLTSTPQWYFQTWDFRELDGTTHLRWGGYITPGYRMPIWLRVNFSDGTSRDIRTWVDGDGPQNYYETTFHDTPPALTITSIDADPDSWVLRKSGSTPLIPLPPLQIYTTSLPPATQFTPYETWIYTSPSGFWSLAPQSPPLPYGLSVDSRNVFGDGQCRLKGTPAGAPGNYPIILRHTAFGVPPQVTTDFPFTLRLLQGNSEATSWYLYE
jgi:aminopeptidase N